jgi:hypothetical protein
VAALTGEIEDEGQAADISTLNAAISAVRTAGDIDGRIALAEKEIKVATDTAANLSKSLRPALTGKVDIASFRHRRNLQSSIIAIDAASFPMSSSLPRTNPQWRTGA